MNTELTSLYKQRKNEIKQRLREFQSVPPDEYFYELVYCILTPQTNAFSADKAVQVLKNLDFQNRDIDPFPYLHCKDYYIRFHKTKAQRLCDLKNSFPPVQSILSNDSLTAFKKREQIVKIVNGFGLKEATHFMRNVGQNDGLAIIDRHILRNLVKYEVIDDVPKTISKKHYYELEMKFDQFARRIKIPLDELDLLFWSMETGVIFK